MNFFYVVALYRPVTCHRWPVHTWGQVNAPAPRSNRALRGLEAKWRRFGTVQDRRKKRPSAREGAETVTTEDMVDEVSRLSPYLHLVLHLAPGTMFFTWHLAPGSCYPGRGVCPSPW